MSVSIFVSYRRTDTAAEATAITLVLRTEYGHDAVFLDHSSVWGGTEWPASIQQSLRAATHVIVVIGPDWIGKHNHGSDARIHDENDWVRQEVECALDKPVCLPVFVRGAGFPAKNDLPKSIEGLLNRQAVSIRPDHWDHDVKIILDHFGRGSSSHRIVRAAAATLVVAMLATLAVLVSYPEFLKGQPQSTREQDNATDRRSELSELENQGEAAEQETAHKPLPISAANLSHPKEQKQVEVAEQETAREPLPISATNLSHLKRKYVVETPDLAGEVAVDPANRWIASTHKGKVILWDLDTGDERKTLSFESDEDVNAVAFSHGGEFIAAGSDDGTVCIWDTANFRVERIVPSAKREWVRNVLFTPQEQLIYSSGDDVVVLRQSDWSTITTLKNPEAINASVQEVALASRSGLLAVGYLSGRIAIFSTENWLRQNSWHPNPSNHSRITALAFDIDEDHLLAGTGNLQNADCGVYITKVPEYATAVALGHRGWVFDLEFVAPNVWSGIQESESQTGHVRILFRDTDGNEVLPLQIPDLHLQKFAIAQDRTTFAVAGSEDLVSSVPPGAGWVDRPQRHVIRIFRIDENVD